MDKNRPWSRRKFSKAVVSAQLLIASGTLGSVLSCITETKKKNAQEEPNLNINQRKLLKELLAIIIPKSNKMPSAADLDGDQYILSITAELPDIKELFISLLKLMEELSYTNFNSPFSKLNSKNRLNLITSYETAYPQLFKVLKDFVYESYYINENIWPLINYKSYATGTTGPEMEPFDSKLLSRVSSLPSSYIKI